MTSFLLLVGCFIVLPILGLIAGVWAGGRLSQRLTAALRARRQRGSR